MIKIFSLLKGVIVVIFVSFGKVQTDIFFDKINFENFLLIKLYIQNIKNWERASDIQELFKKYSNLYSSVGNKDEKNEFSQPFLFIQTRATSQTVWPSTVCKNNTPKILSFVITVIISFLTVAKMCASKGLK